MMQLKPRCQFALESYYLAEMPAPEFPIVLNTGRLQHQWHTMTKTGKIPMLNKLNPKPFIEIHPEDAAAREAAHRIACA